MPPRSRRSGRWSAAAAPHAVLLVGPGGRRQDDPRAGPRGRPAVHGPDPADRPCRACRGCRMVAHGGHPDLHRLGPDGPGGQIVIGGPDAKVRGVRDLTGDLALMPMEGGARVAIIEAAHRMNEDAQAALLKTLEEPPAGVTIILCADDEDRLLPTVRSRCARLRLGPVAAARRRGDPGEHGVADAAAGRLASPGSPADGPVSPSPTPARRTRSGLAGSCARILLDLPRAAPPRRLAAIAVRRRRRSRCDLRSSARHGRRAARRATAAADAAEAPGAAGRRGRGGRRHGRPAAGSDPGRDPTDGDAATTTTTPARPSQPPVAVAPPRPSIAVWMDVARDLALVGADGARSVRDPDLLEEFTAAAADLPDGAAARVPRPARSAGPSWWPATCSPELVLDSLVLAWPRRAGPPDGRGPSRPSSAGVSRAWGSATSPSARRWRSI